MAKPRKIESRTAVEESTHERDVRWVLQHLSDRDTSQWEREKTAPSKAALQLFKMYDVDDGTRMTFVEKIYSRVVQKEKPAEAGKGMSDDQRKFFRLFDLIEAERPEFLNERDRRPTAPPVVVEPAELAVADEPIIIPEPAPRVEDSAVAAGSGIDEPGTAVVEPDIDPFSLAEIVNSQAQTQAGCGV